ncbi:MAG TPA: hypothetical protein VGK61_04985, partial [Planctomycetota bacterium]
MSNASQTVEGDTESLRRRLAELELIAAYHAESGRILKSGGMPSSSGLLEFVDMTRKHFTLVSAAYYRVEAAAQELAVEAASAESGAQPQRFKLGEGATGRAAQSGSTVRTDNGTGGAGLA